MRSLGRIIFIITLSSVTDLNPQAVCIALSDTNPEWTAQTILFAAAIPRFRREALCIFTAAVLILLAASARAGIVSADLGFLALLGAA